MPSKRMIHPSFWQSEKLSRITREYRLFFAGLFSNADDQGRIRGHPAIVRSTLFPYDDISIEEVTAGIKAVEELGVIVVYEVGGSTYIQIVNWWEHQNLQWAYPSSLPAPDGWQDRLRYREDGKVKTVNWEEPGGFVTGAQRPESGPDNGNSPHSNNGTDPGEIVDPSLHEVPKELPEPLPKALPITNSQAYRIEESSLNINNNNESPAPTTYAPITPTHPRASPDFDQKWSQFVNLYEEHFGLFSSALVDDLKDYCDRCRIPWFREACKRCDENGVRKWSYCKSILDSFIQAGKVTDKPPGRNGARHATHQNNHQSHSSQHQTGHDLAAEPTFDPYERREIPPGAH